MNNNKLNKNLLNLRNDFPFFANNQHLVFLDSAATSLKPKPVINAINDYYTKYSINTHSIDYPLAVDAKAIFESCRTVVAQFLNSEPDEVIFCPGATFAFNQIAFSLGKYLQPGDEVVLTNCEHGSLLLPFYRLKAEKGIVLRFIDVAGDGLITVDNLKKVLTNKTKIVAFASMNNTLGTINDVAQLTAVIKAFLPKPLDEKTWPFKNIMVLIDGAQGAAHIKTDVKKWNVDFFTFSGHKVFAPTGISVWWSKKAWLDIMEPLLLGGGMNGRIYPDGNYTLLAPPHRFEAGTQHVAGVFGLKAAIEYLLTIGFANMHQHEAELKQYAIEQLNQHLKDKITIYNHQFLVGTLLFNINGVFAEDVANYLGTENVCVRSGNFCAKLISSVINCASAIRVSFLIYNNKADIDQLVAALVKGLAEGGDFLNGFFGRKK